MGWREWLESIRLPRLLPVELEGGVCGWRRSRLRGGGKNFSRFLVWQRGEFVIEYENVLRKISSNEFVGGELQAITFSGGGVV